MLLISIFFPVNSKFTASVCRETFSFLKTFQTQNTTPDSLFVVYPAVEVEEDRISIENNAKEFETFKSVDLIKYTSSFDKMFLSLNRFERKKNLELAILSFDVLIKKLSESKSKTKAQDLLLVVAGGYDPAVEENISYFEELNKLTKDLNLENNVIFRKSIGNDERIALINKATALLYTPDREHFGIVPIESMSLGTPVIAVNSGGPLETIVDGVTGFLCPQTNEDFAAAMEKFITTPELKIKFGKEGIVRVKEMFSRKALGNKLEDCLNFITKNTKSPSFIFILSWTIALIMLGQLIGYILKYMIFVLGIRLNL